MTAAATDANLAIRVRDLSKAYRVYDRPFDRLKEMVLRRPCHQIVHALHPLSFDVLRGQCVGVVGANGAGKTTLLSLLTGTLAPSTGSIEVFGRVSAILGLGVGMLPTHTGRENIRHGLITRGIAPDLHEQLEREIIDFSELGAAIDHAVSTYSSGMAMRLNFSIAHAVEPDILIVDEALAVGDARFTFKCQKKMREFLDRGKTLFFVSHNLATVRELCDHGLLLDKGRLLCAGDVADVLRQYQLLYFGEAVAVRQAHNSRQQAQWGRDDIDIASVDVQGADATPDGTWAVAQGNPIELTVRVRVRQPVPWPGIGIIVTTGYGMRVSGFSTANHIDPLPPLPPGEFTFRYRMPTYLQAGDYRLELIIADMSSAPPRLLGIWDSLLRLRVQWNDYLVQGLVDCGAEIELAGQWMSMDRERRRRLGRRQPINL